MTHRARDPADPAGQPFEPQTGTSLKFEHDNTFQRELRRRVEEHFRTTGQRQRDCWQMYVKTAVLLAGFAARMPCWYSGPARGGRACFWPCCWG